MIVVQINAICGAGSTGKICKSISELLCKQSIENYIIYSIGNSDYEKSFKYSSYCTQKYYALYSRVMGDNGFNAFSATKKLIHILKEIQPTIIHLHNIHSNDVNLELLFQYIRETNTKVVWTFHDCWAFTGYCMHFDYIKCTKWYNQCCNCPQKKKYSWFFDRSKELYQRKKRTYINSNMVIVTPSKWLAALAKKSFLRNHDIRVINNGIDLSVFYPVISNWKKDHIVSKKYMVLGVSFEWSIKKGINTIIYLSKHLNEDYQIVLVGTNDAIDKILPKNIITIHRTNNQKELAEIYSAADVFVNPTLEENYPTVNMESIACGTPVVSFDTGGSSEIVVEGCGIIVEKENNKAMLDGVVNICENKAYSSKSCMQAAKTFDMWKRFSEYIDLYDSL
ncbi:Glycosyltransferase involved in cell wall bisynthesis [Ruminococcus sp. YE71]|uniref:glycosyltransferase n=1 Tax=unclassified Ruminococcus TaxID=2608920 RepID=UPI000883357E|nr:MULTISPECIES: glycosyltransferase [unclassified Ruminococcus]SDA11366.1 Glycosyltransferase involved in cell wall bisynthesis [Ruminococcus sp. YE78]SFW15147.1 Glycosyltransferase involved in cell wall bisynthesis [Ruminococcus sp. YE71]